MFYFVFIPFSVFTFIFFMCFFVYVLSFLLFCLLLLWFIVFFFLYFLSRNYIMVNFTWFLPVIHSDCASVFYASISVIHFYHLYFLHKHQILPLVYTYIYKNNIQPINQSIYLSIYIPITYFTNISLSLKTNQQVTNYIFFFSQFTSILLSSRTLQ